ncbi:MAG: hypothetical protein V3V18_06920 [Methylococcales bacterium]
MIKKMTLLRRVLSLTLIFTISMAADVSSDTGFQNTIPISSLDTLLNATDEKAECIAIDDSTETTWNAGEICFASDKNSSTANLSVANAQSRAASLEVSENIVGDSSRLGAECISDGGSFPASDSPEGFCLAADLNTSISGLANFAVANELPVAGMQFLQATFADGSTLGANAPISADSAECVSAGGSLSSQVNSEGFCLASDLSRSASTFANFAVANGLPVVGLQFLQVLFSETGASSDTNTDCASVGGSSAATGSTGGFCLASDLSTSTAGLANFSVAHDVPVTNLQFLQVTFEDAESSSESFSFPGAGAPSGAECISVDDSIAAIANPQGFCLVSDLMESLEDSADITIANNLSVSGMQFLQAEFAAGGLPASSGGGAECASDAGSIAAAGNPEGFCLVADLINSTMESANIAVANDLPVVAWEFIQVPSENVPPLDGSGNPTDAGVPVGVVVSGFEEFPFIPTPDDLPEEISSSALVDSVESQTPFFHLSDQTNGIEIYSTPYWRTYPHLGLWIGR